MNEFAVGWRVGHRSPQQLQEAEIPGEACFSNEDTKTERVK